MKRFFAACALLIAIVPLWLAPGVASLPPPESIGNLDGSWYYQDPEFQIAIFIDRDAIGTFRMKYHVAIKGSAEFETDAGGYAKYIDDGVPVEVLFTGAPSGPYAIHGYHERTKTGKKETVQEAGDFDLYLSEKGQKLVLLYPELKSSSTDENGRITTSTRKQVSRIFRRASTIVVDWAELPF